jgi:HAE1 family hydrophobic/amphiphilic exporter-1
VFVQGFAAVFFGEMAQVVAFALLCSLTVALTLVPMLTARVFQHTAPGEQLTAPRTARAPFAGWGRRVADLLGRGLERLDEGYERGLRAALTAPWAIVLGSVVLLVSSALMASNIETELMPEADEGRLNVSLELPIGTPLATTSKVMKDVEKRIRRALRSDEFEHMMTSVGPEAWWRPGGSNEGSVDLTMTPVARRQRGIDAIEASVRQSLDGIPGAKIQVRKESANILTRIVRHGDDRLAVEIRGHDLQVADELARKVAGLMLDTPGVTYAKPDREMGQLERVLHVDRQRAAELGLGSADIAEAVEHYVLGKVATRYRDLGDEFDVRVQLALSERERVAQLPRLPIVTSTGRRVALESLVHVEERRGPSSISRVNQERTLRINAGAAGRPIDAIARDLKAQLGSLAVPEGFTVQLGGELEEQQKTFGTLLEGVLLALFLVYATMAIQFESLRHPLVVMLSVPFAFIGVVLTLLATGTTLNMNSLLGVIVLVGIVVNNAIVLIDYTNLLRREHDYPVHRAVVMAARRRLRPILMTTLTTAIGLMPLALGTTEGSEIQAPLARTVVGGLMTSTLVTLVLVPSVYLLMERRRVRTRDPAPNAADMSAEFVSSPNRLRRPADG